jgi:hypothetical protein
MMRADASDEKSALYLECPRSLPPAIKQAARGSMTSASAYMRGAILDRLKRDGYWPNGDAA